MRSSLGRWWRTLRRLRVRQVAALMRQRLAGPIVPVAWEAPSPTLRLRKPRVPFLEAPAHAHFDGQSGFRLLNRELRFDAGVDWDVARAGPLWAYHLHQFDHLRRADLSAAMRNTIVLDWVHRHRAGIGWSPHPTSLRTMNWIKLLLTPGALSLDDADHARVRASLAAQLSTLVRHLETHLLANHYLSNLLAVVFAGLAFEGDAADGWLGQEGKLRRELDEQILPDGAHVERSPMYHALLLEAVLDVLNLSMALPAGAPQRLGEKLREVAGRMLGALQVWTHPDGRIALFGDSALGIAQEPHALERYAAALDVSARAPLPTGVLAAAGFVRLRAGAFDLITSVGPIRPSYQPGHAHADALSFELCIGEERVVTDTGVFEYVPGPRRERSRATRAHSTLEVGRTDQAELWGAHRVGGRPRVGWRLLEPERRLEASCAGWATPGSVHFRSFRVAAQEVEIQDRMEGRPQSVRLTLPLAPGLKPELAGTSARVVLASGVCLEIVLPPACTWRVEPSPYFPEFGRCLERVALVGAADRFTEGRWKLRIGAGASRPAAR